MKNSPIKSVRKTGIACAAAFGIVALSTAAFARKTENAKLGMAQSSTRSLKKTAKTILVPQLTARNQPLVNSMITIDSFTLNQRGWLMSHLAGKNGKPGTMAGVTGPFEPGTYKNVRIKLWGDIKKGDKVWPMLHLDSGPKPRVFEPKEDHHVDFRGKTVTKQIIVTDVKGALPQTGNYIVMPSCCMAGAPLGATVSASMAKTARN